MEGPKHNELPTDDDEDAGGGGKDMITETNCTEEGLSTQKEQRGEVGSTIIL